MGAEPVRVAARGRALLAAEPAAPACALGRHYRDVGVGVALGNPFGGGMTDSATYAANLGAAR